MEIATEIWRELGLRHLLISGWVVFLGFLLKHYAKPHIAYKELGEDSEKRLRFILKNFEPLTLRDELRLNVESSHGLEEVIVNGGPWFKKFLEPKDPDPASGTPKKETERLTLVFAGFPAEGAVSLVVKTVGAGKVTLSVDKSSAMKPRSFDDIPAWSSARYLRVAFQSVIGIITAVLVFNFFVPNPFDKFAKNPMRYSAVLAVIFISAPLLWAFISPFGGKELIQGFLGGRQSTTKRRWPKDIEHSDTDPDWVSP